LPSSCFILGLAQPQYVVLSTWTCREWCSRESCLRIAIVINILQKSGKITMYDGEVWKKLARAE